MKRICFNDSEIGRLRMSIRQKLEHLKETRLRLEGYLNGLTTSKKPLAVRQYETNMFNLGLDEVERDFNFYAALHEKLVKVHESSSGEVCIDIK